LDFEATLAQVSQWIGSPVNVQVLGDAGMVLNIEGVLGQLMSKDGEPMPSAFTLDSCGGTFLWLEREHHRRTIWANNAHTVLLIETMGLAVTIEREPRR
jgi:hypothetical protein